MSEENVVQEVVKVTSVLIDVKTQEYPLFISDILKRNPNVTMPLQPLLEDIEAMGYALVHPTDRPAEGVSTEVPPYEYDGSWFQRWDTRPKNESELAAELESAKTLAHNTIIATRDQDFSKGMPWTLDENPDAFSNWFHVQIRPDDKSNLLLLNLEAHALETAGSEEKLMFRSYENISVELSPTQMIDMISAAVAVGKSIYKKSWDLKDLVDTATTLEEMPSIPSSFI